MKTYKIIASTNGYIASRDVRFRGRTEYVVESCLTLRDAQKKLLEMFNHDYENEIGMPFRNWGLAHINRPDVTHSFLDGTRSYEYDSRKYSIEYDQYYLLDGKTKKELIEYVSENEIVWQMCDSLIEFSHADDELMDDEKDEYYARYNDMLSVLKNARVCQVFDIEKNGWGAFGDLVDWANRSDMLLLVDEDLMLCIAGCDEDLVLRMLG